MVLAFSSSLAADNLEKTQKKQLESQVKVMTAEAQKLGLDMIKYNSCITNSTYLTKIESQISEAETNGGNGTPYTVILNTKTGKQYPISGALPLAQIQQVVAQAEAGQ